MTDIVFPDPVDEPEECAAVCENDRPCQNMGRYVFHHRVIGDIHLCRMHYRSEARKGRQKQ